MNGLVLSIRLSFLFAFLLPCRLPAAETATAGDVLERTGIRGGLVVVLGCEAPDLIADLRAGDSFLVRGLDTDLAKMEQARKAIQARGLYGPVSVDRFEGDKLPFVDNLVNLMVVSDSSRQVSDEELMRVVAPGGVLCTIGHSPLTIRHSVKPRPAEIDDWTHWLHGPDNNAVSRDRQVGVSSSLQWIMPPLWGRHHNLLHVINAMVSANGRVFVIIDEAPIAVRGLADRWVLLCRDAFNGLDLWRRPLADWGWRKWSPLEVGIEMRYQSPEQLLNRLVAVDDVVYVTLGFEAPVTALDARTGQTLRTYAGTERTATISFREGTLYLTRNAAGDNTQVDVMAVDAKTGKVLWERPGFRGVSPHSNFLRQFRDLHPTLGDRQVFLVDGDDVVAVDGENGKEMWRVPRPEYKKGVLGHYGFDHAQLCTLVYRDGLVYLGQLHSDSRNLNVWQEKDMEIRAYDASTGRTLWHHAGMSLAHFRPPDLFVNRGLVWTLNKGELKHPTLKNSTDVSLVGLDAKTGEVRKTFSIKDAVASHHHRCYRDKATENFYLAGEEGIEYIDFTTGQINVHHWLRGACAYGTMPANGLLYLPPNACGCQAGSKFNGFFALASRQPAGSVRMDSAKRLDKGFAYGRAISGQISSRETDWPVYKHDNRRSNATCADLPAELSKKWSATIGGCPTAPIVSDGKVFLAAQDRHEVLCLAADSGEVIWRFTADGRIDSPPTFAGGRVLFGTRAGSVYALTADKGVPIWRFLAAPAQRGLISFGQLESVWPLHGSIFVQKGRAYCVAGRSMNLDGGLYAYALDIDTGAVLQETQLQASEKGAGVDDSVMPDILVGGNEGIFMRKMQFDPENIEQFRVNSKTIDGLLWAVDGNLLDATWYNSAFWQLGDVKAQMLAFDERDVVGIAAYRKQVTPSSAHDVFTIGQGYRVFAVNMVHRGDESVAKSGEKARSTAWEMRIPLRAQALILTPKNLCLAGVPDAADRDDPWAAFEGRKGAWLRIVSRENGSTLAEYQLDSAPVYDGMAADAQRLFIALRNGELVCYGKK